MKKLIGCGAIILALMLVLIPATQAMNAHTVQQSTLLEKVLSNPIIPDEMKEKIGTYTGIPSLDALLLVLASAGLTVLVALIIYIYVSLLTPSI